MTGRALNKGMTQRPAADVTSRTWEQVRFSATIRFSFSELIPLTTTVLIEVKGLILEDIHGNKKLKHSVPSPTSAPIFRQLLNSQQKHREGEMAQQVKHLLPSLAAEFDSQVAQHGRRKWTCTSCCPLASL